MKAKYYLLNKTVLCIELPHMECSDTNAIQLPSVGNLYTVRDYCSVRGFRLNEVNNKSVISDRNKEEIFFPKKYFYLFSDSMIKDAEKAILRLLDYSS